MSTRCGNCGSPISFDGDKPTKCPFCHVENTPPPKELLVAIPVATTPEAAASLPVDVGDRRCPHCRRRLVTVSTEGVDLSGCGACGGIWVDNASARRVLAKPDPIFADLARRAAAGATGSRGKAEKPTCAECPAVLDRVLVAGLELDTCSDHGTWFDAGELTSLVRMLRHEPVDPTTPGAAVFCQRCGAQIMNGRGNITEYGLTCEACWRAETRELVAAADARMEDNAAVAGAMFGVGALLLGALGSSTKS